MRRSAFLFALLLTVSLATGPRTARAETNVDVTVRPATSDPAVLVNAIAICADGGISFDQLDSAVCAGHGGVARFIDRTNPVASALNALAQVTGAAPPTPLIAANGSTTPAGAVTPVVGGSTVIVPLTSALTALPFGVIAPSFGLAPLANFSTGVIFCGGDTVTDLGDPFPCTRSFVGLSSSQIAALRNGTAVNSTAVTQFLNGLFPGGVPLGATAICADFSFSFSQTQGTSCRFRGGVLQYLVPLPP